MRLISRATLQRFWSQHPEAETALREWANIVARSTWRCSADVKATFNSVDSIGNQRYVFNIKGNNFRVVVVIQFTPQLVYIRFVGTHQEYDKIDCKTI